MKFIELIKILEACFSKRSALETQYGQDVYDNDEELMPNIYDEKRFKDYANRFKNLHIKLKYRCIVPLCVIFRWIFDKQIKKDIPNHKWNKNFKIFNESVDESLFFWYKYFVATFNSKKPLSDDEINKRITELSGGLMPLITLKELVIKVGLDDTAYRELFNIIMFTLANKMSKEYGKTHKHLFYNTTNACDVEYYNMCWDELEKMKKVVVN